MEKYYLKGIIGVFLIVLSGCSTTRELTLNTMEPAPVELATTIKKIGIVDNSASVEADPHKDQLTAIVAKQDKRLAQKGTEAAISGLFDELVKDQRFDTIVLIEDITNHGPVGNLQSEIPWDSFKSLCETHGVDAIFALAYYETETKVSVKKTKMDQPDMLRVKWQIPGHEITLETLIENGWRIYDPYTSLIIDEFVFNDQIVSSAKGINPVRALQAIDNRSEAIILQSKSSGSTYGLRLQPYEQSIVREYYVKGSDNLVLAGQMAVDGHWEQAATLWLQDNLSDKTKVRARACHNLAVLNEYNGQLDVAVEWATKAYNHQNNKAAQQYLDALKHRIDQNHLVQEQLAVLSSFN